MTASLNPIFSTGLRLPSAILISVPRAWQPVAPETRMFLCLATLSFRKSSCEDESVPLPTSAWGYMRFFDGFLNATTGLETAGGLMKLHLMLTIGTTATRLCDSSEL